MTNPIGYCQCHSSNPITTDSEATKQRASASAVVDEASKKPIFLMA